MLGPNTQGRRRIYPKLAARQFRLTVLVRPNLLARQNYVACSSKVSEPTQFSCSIPKATFYVESRRTWAIGLNRNQGFNVSHKLL